MKRRKLLFIITIIYNLIGVVSLFMMYPDDPLSWESGWSQLIILLTLPITFFSFVYRYAQSEPLYPVFIIQFIVLIISLFIVHIITRNNKK